MVRAISAKSGFRRGPGIAGENARAWGGGAWETDRVIVDAALVRHVESAAARLTAWHVDALRGQDQGDAKWQALDSGVLAAMGRGRYVNRGVGLGLGDTPAEELLDTLELFYDDADLPPMLEVCPWVDTALVDDLRRRGYVVQWFRNVYAHSLRTLPPRASMAVVEVQDGAMEDEWTAIIGSQFEAESAARRNSDEFCAALRTMQRSMDLVALLDERPIATGSITPVRTVAWLGGASTLPEARGRGAQHALLIDRLHRAARMGCKVAAVTATPDGVSARNLLRVGFRLLYTQAVMARP